MDQLFAQVVTCQRVARGRAARMRYVMLRERVLRDQRDAAALFSEIERRTDRTYAAMVKLDRLDKERFDRHKRQVRVTIFPFKFYIYLYIFVLHYLCNLRDPFVDLLHAMSNVPLVAFPPYFYSLLENFVMFSRFLSVIICMVLVRKFNLPWLCNFLNMS